MENKNWSKWLNLGPEAGKQLAEARKAAGLRAVQVEQQINLARQTLHNYEAGRQRRISLERLQAMCSLYNVDIKDIDIDTRLEHDRPANGTGGMAITTWEVNLIRDIRKLSEMDRVYVRGIITSLSELEELRYLLGEEWNNGEKSQK